LIDTWRQGGLSTSFGKGWLSFAWEGCISLFRVFFPNLNLNLAPIHAQEEDEIKIRSKIKRGTQIVKCARLTKSGGLWLAELMAGR
jgi:hypothetical protein